MFSGANKAQSSDPRCGTNVRFREEVTDTQSFPESNNTSLGFLLVATIGCGGNPQH